MVIISSFYRQGLDSYWATCPVHYLGPTFGGAFPFFLSLPDQIGKKNSLVATQAHLSKKEANSLMGLI